MNNEITQRSENGANPDKDLSDVVAMVAAVNHAREGRPVFPCQQKKRPYTSNGFKDATRDEDTIVDWWTKWPDALIGMPTGDVSGIDVLDIDVKNDHDGEATLREMEKKHGALPETTEVRTQSGGRHLWFRHADGLTSNVGTLGDGLDVRADGGYVIVPGSGNYAFTKETDTPDTPAWIVEGSAAGPTDRPTEQPPPAAAAGVLPAGQRNQGLTREAGRMRHIGMEAEEIEAALLAMNEKRCKPPLAEHEVRSIARSISTYQPGAAEPDARAINIPTWTELSVDRDEAKRANLTPTCIVEEYLYADVAQLAAPGGTGKTTLILWEAAHIALGKKLWGQDVRTPGKTLIVTAEDERERLVARLNEVVKAMVLKPDEVERVFDSIAVYDVAGSGIKLTRMNGHNIELTPFADNIVSAFKDDPPVLIVFDPLVSFGASEQAVNDNEQALVMASRRIVKGLKCCVRLIHHTGKQNARDGNLDQYASRGGSALADGSRMTAVMQVWNPEAQKKLPLPEDLVIEPDESVVVLNRAKLSYSRPNRPMWFIKRSGFKFEHYEQGSMDSAKRTERLRKRVLELLGRQIRGGMLKSQTELEKSMPKALSITRNDFRDLLESLMVSGELVLRDLPQHLKHGRRKDFYCPADMATEELTVVPLKEEGEAE